MGRLGFTSYAVQWTHHVRPHLTLVIHPKNGLKQPSIGPVPPEIRDWLPMILRLLEEQHLLQVGVGFA
jgi:hypothetical protein